MPTNPEPFGFGQQAHQTVADRFGAGDAHLGMNESLLLGLVKHRAVFAGELEAAQAKVWQLFADLPPWMR